MSIAVAYMYLLGAILCEVTATISLRLCESFTKFWPSVVVLVGYSLSFYFLSFTLKLIPIGIAYAIWSGLGLILITAIGWVYLRQQLDLDLCATDVHVAVFCPASPQVAVFIQRPRISEDKVARLSLLWVRWVKGYVFADKGDGFAGDLCHSAISF